MTARQALQRHVITQARARGAAMKCGVCRELLRFQAGTGYVHVDGESERDGHVAIPRRV